MTISPRRAFSILLTAALLLGSVPPEAQARFVRVAAGETGRLSVMPTGGSASMPKTLSALNLTGTSLNGNFSTPLIAPAPYDPAVAVVPAIAAALSPTTARTVEAKTWKQRFASVLGLKPTAPTASAAEIGAGFRGLAFDGAIEISGVADGPAVSGETAATRPSGLVLGSTAKSIVDEFGGPKLDPASTNAVSYGAKWGFSMIGISALIDLSLRPLLDAFPWPQYLSEKILLGFGRVVLMVKAGPAEIMSRIAESPLQFFGLDLPSALVAEEISFRLLGFGTVTLFLAGLKPASLWLSGLLKGLPDAAGAAGGMESLLKTGLWLSRRAFPIAAAMSAVGFATAHFQQWGISPYVLISNLVLGLVLARTAYAGRALPAPRWAQGVFLAYLAYTGLAAFGGFALMSSVGMHFAIPILSAALFLGHIFGITGGAIKGALAVGRGLIAPFTAHLVFNLAALGSIAVGLTVSPAAAVAYSIIAGLLGISTLLYSYLSARKENGAKLTNGGKALVALLIASAGLSMVSPSEFKSVSDTAGRIEVQGSVPPISASPAVDIPATDAAKIETAVVESHADMVARVKPAVVNVIVHVGDRVLTGSGFILTPNGIFITNGHVINNTKAGEFVNARVPGVDGELRAKVLAVNHDKDLAIVQLQPRPDGKPWPTVKLAASAPREGDAVTAIGYPKNLGFSISVGNVSAMNGRGNMYVKHLQTDAALNPGNSGGPLFNDKGEVIGVNSEIVSTSGGSQGLGFAIQAPEVDLVMRQYAETGDISTASLGIIVNLSNPAASETGLDIEFVRRGSAAEKAGLRPGDLLIGIDGEPIGEGGQNAARRVATILGRMIPGQRTTLMILRDTPLEIELTVDAKASEAPGH